jgi:hypothetical protein
MIAGGLLGTATYASGVFYAALISAGVLTVILVPYKIYRFNFGWAKASATVVYLLYTALGVLAGWGGYEAASAIGWQPAPHSAVLTGILFGAFGQAAARVHFARIPGGESADVITLLSVAGDWLGGVLDWHVPRAVERRLAKLPPDQLAQYVERAYAKSVRESNLRTAAKKQLKVQMEDAIKGLAATNEASKRQARTTLLVLGEDWVMTYRLDRPRSE